MNPHRDKKKVLFLHHGTGVGGAPISMIKTIKNIDSSVFEVEVLLLRDSAVRQMLVSEGIPVSVAKGRYYEKYHQYFSHEETNYYRFWEWRKILSRALFWVMSTLIYSGRLLREYSFDVIHLNGTVLTDFLRAGARQGKVVIHIRDPVAAGYFGLRLAWIRNQINKHADHVIAISDDNARRINLLPKTTVVYNFSEIRGNVQDVGELTEKVALYVGGASLIKGFATMVASLDHLDEGVSVWFCGYFDDATKQSLLRDIRKKLLAIIFPSHRRLASAQREMRTHPAARVMGLRSDIPDLMTQSHVLVSPFEVGHFSRPVVEAFANGRPAIGTRVAGMEELIFHKVDGILVERGQPKALAAAINLLCGDLDLNRRMSALGHAKAIRLFSPANAMAVNAVYKEVLAAECESKLASRPR